MRSHTGRKDSNKNQKRNSKVSPFVQDAIKLGKGKPQHTESGEGWRSTKLHHVAMRTNSLLEYNQIGLKSGFHWSPKRIHEL